MVRIVFSTSMPGFRPTPSRDPVWGILASVAYFAAICGAASTGWTHGGFVWAILYGLLAIVAFPVLLLIGGFVFLALYPLLAAPGSLIATQLGWTSFSPYSERRQWLQRISVLLLLAPLAILLQRYPWSILRILTGVATLGLLALVALVCLLVLVMARVHRSTVQQGESQFDEINSQFQRIRPDYPRLPPPGESEIDVDES